MEDARREGRPIAWVRHHNNPGESPAKPAFIAGTWGAEFSPGLGPLADSDNEAEFVKNVFGAFTGTNIGSWLEKLGSDDVLLVGFFAHMCVSTTAREALMRGLRVSIDPDGTGGFPCDTGCSASYPPTKFAALRCSNSTIWGSRWPRNGR